MNKVDRNYKFIECCECPRLAISARGHFCESHRMLLRLLLLLQLYMLSISLTMSDCLC